MNKPNKPNQNSSTTPRPEIEPNPGSLPKESPKPPEPMSAQGPKKSQTSPDEDVHERSGSGEDPAVESGETPDDPEQPRRTDEAL
jgi:hypothetical protein